MSILTLHKHCRVIVSLIAIPLLLLIVGVPELALARFQGKPEVRNINLELKEEIAIITYDLIGQVSETYQVSAALVKEGDPSYRITVKSATGDIGKGKFAGVRRQIQWEWRKDVPKDFTGGSEYSIELLATPVEEEGGGSWLYYVLGGVLIAGGAIAYVTIIKPQSETSTMPAPPSSKPF